MDLPVTHGAIPTDLEGSFVRTGPNPRFPERLDQRRYHFFAGDAMVHGVELTGGKANYRNRWVQTRGLRRDLASMGDTVGQPAPRSFGKGTGGGNTAMVYHAGRCLALSEGTQGAWQLALPSLDTVGFFTFGDELRHNFTAHPKVCAATGELHFFGYGSSEVGPDNDRTAHVHYYAASSDGTLQVKDVPVQFRRPIMVHDMALSRKHAVFFDMPLWDMTTPVSSDDTTRVGILPRGASAQAVQWFEARVCYGYHTANAWDDVEVVAGADNKQEHDCVELIYCSSERFHFQRSNADSLFRHRWRFDLTNGELLADEDICDVPCEFPVVNPAVVGLKTRYIWANVLVSEPSPLSSNGMMKYDVLARDWTVHTFEGNRRGGECFFAPRLDSRTEDDGYLLCYTNVFGTTQSDLYIMDAASMELVAIVSLGGAFVPNGFHAFWIDAARYADGQQRFGGLQSEPDAIPKIGELDWTGTARVARL